MERFKSSHLLGGDFHAHVTTGNHDGVSLFEDCVVVLDPFLVLNFGDDLRARQANDGESLERAATVFDFLPQLQVQHA